MNNGLDPLAHAKDTLLDLAIRFGTKLLVAILIVPNRKVVGEILHNTVGFASPRSEWVSPRSCADVASAFRTHRWKCV
jgi:hypothetical protein